MGFSNTAGPRSALEFVGMPVIRDSDPVLNLNDGRKIRVYLGGDPSYMVVEAHSLMEIHDNEALEVQERKKKERPQGRKRFIVRYARLIYRRGYF